MLAVWKEEWDLAKRRPHPAPPGGERLGQFLVWTNDDYTTCGSDRTPALFSDDGLFPVYTMRARRHH